MIVTKQMHNKELQCVYYLGRVIAWLVRRVWGIYLVQCVYYSIMRGWKLRGFVNQQHYIDMIPPTTCSSSSKDDAKEDLKKKKKRNQLRVLVFRPKGSEGKRLPAMLYIHGGGFLLGTPEQDFKFYKNIMTRRDVVIVAPDYRRAIQHPYPAAFDDCYTTLLWMKTNSKELGIHEGRFIVAGHSAGGGLAAAVTLKARDTKDVAIAFQMPIYPMLDHRMITKSSRMTGATLWSSETNQFAWGRYLKGLQGVVDRHDNHDQKTAVPEDGVVVPVYASPALNENFVGLPPTISFVGDLEPFLDEDVTYMESLQQAGVPTKFRIFEGAYHAFENSCPNTTISKEANAFQLDSFEEYYDKYCTTPGVLPA